MWMPNGPVRARLHIYDYNARIALFRSGKREHDGMCRPLSRHRATTLHMLVSKYRDMRSRSYELLFGSDMNMITLGRVMRARARGKGGPRGELWTMKI